MSQIETGSYRAKPVNWGFGESPVKSTPFIFIDFGFQDRAGDYQTKQWRGYLTTDSQKRTIESVIYCGFQGDDLDVLSNGAAGRALDVDHEVEIVIDFDNKNYLQIKWINQIGNVQAKNTSSAKEFVKNLKLNESLAEIKKDLNDDVPPPSLNEDEDIGF